MVLVVMDYGTLGGLGSVAEVAVPMSGNLPASARGGASICGTYTVDQRNKL